MGKIWANITDFVNTNIFFLDKLVVTSGGFDPLHVGHVRCIQDSVQQARDIDGLLVVLVNGDGFLTRKKNFVFMPQHERCEIIAALDGVDHVVLWDDGTQTVEAAIKILRPKFFMKGGDRSSPESVPELAACQSVGCQIIFGAGGTDKIQSSSELAARIKQLHV